MAGASILRQLSDEDVEALHHKLRRDAESDLAIAKWAEGRLRSGGQAGGLGPTDAARIMVIARYRKGRPYRRWLETWENQDRQLKSEIALQRQRFEYLTSLVQGTGERGLYEASNHLKARLLTIAAGMTDRELAAGDVKWLKGLLQEIRDAEKLDRQSQVEKLKAEIERMMNAPRTRRVSAEDVVAKVDEVMGVKRKDEG
jgi:hypothetical protein